MDTSKSESNPTLPDTSARFDMRVEGGGIRVYAVDGTYTAEEVRQMLRKAIEYKLWLLSNINDRELIDYVW